MSLLRIVVTIGCTVAFAVVCLSTVRAADDPSGKAAQGNKVQAKDNNADEEKVEDPYALPEGGVKELLAFIEKLRTFRPKSNLQRLVHQNKMMSAIKAAAEKIQQIATDEDKQLDGYQDVAGLLLLFRVQESQQASPADVRKLAAEIKDQLTSSDAPSAYTVSAARTLCAMLEYSDAPQMPAVDAYREFGALLARSKDEKLAAVGLQMEGAARRLDLVGNPLELSGTLIDGKKFNWKSYQGKVVLVDFWATWCGPCRAEMPNVKKNYERYHDRGFEVVGISLDKDRQALEQFLEDEKTPWVTLHDGDWEDNAVAQYYGVMGIPTVLLVGKEGKVISLNARGPELGRLLEEQLGPAQPADAKDPGAAEKSDESAAP